MTPALLAGALALAVPTSRPPALGADADAPDTVERAALAAAFAGRVRLAEGATPEESGLFDEALRAVLRTPTGRSLAEAFLAAPGGPVTVRFEDLERVGGRAVVVDGQDAVALTRSVLGWRRDWAVLRAAELLGHELLGHVLSHRLARAVGAEFEHGASLEDEVNAGLVGILVVLEAGWRFLDPVAADLLRDRAAYEEALHWRQPEYAVALRDGELADPVLALRGRRARVAISLADPGARALYAAALDERLALLSQRPELAAALAAYASHPFHARLAADIAARVARLRALAPPFPESQSPVARAGSGPL